METCTAVKGSTLDAREESDVYDSVSEWSACLPVGIHALSLDRLRPCELDPVDRF